MIRVYMAFDSIPEAVDWLKQFRYEDLSIRKDKKDGFFLLSVLVDEDQYNAWRQKNNAEVV